MRAHNGLISCALAALPLTAAAASAHAQEIIDLEAWQYEELYAGHSAEQLIGEAEVYDEDGEEIGELEDMIVGPDGQVENLIIEAGGFLDIGDTHFAYPFEKADLTQPDAIFVEIDEDNIESYSVFQDVDDQPAQRRNWRIRELINDYAYLEGGYRYGWIDDVIIGRDGQIDAVVVYADVRYAAPRVVALPFESGKATFEPGEDYFQLPYTPDEVAKLEVYVYREPELQQGG